LSGNDLRDKPLRAMSIVCEMVCENFVHLQPVNGRALGILIGLDVRADDRFLRLPAAQLFEFG
jgi:hypothetical protein